MSQQACGKVPVAPSNRGKCLCRSRRSVLVGSLQGMEEFLWRPRREKDGCEHAGKAGCVCALWREERSELALAGGEIAMRVAVAGGASLDRLSLTCFYPRFAPFGWRLCSPVSVCIGEPWRSTGGRVCVACLCL